MISPRRRQALGIASAVVSFTIWSLYAVMWAALKKHGAVPLEILAHRVLWAHVFCWGLVVAPRLGKGRDAASAAADAAREPAWPSRTRDWLFCVINGLLNSANWLICIWAATSGHLIEASFGYFLAPVMAAFLGLVIFKEQLNGPQRASVAVAAATVATIFFAFGTTPWIPLVAGGTAAGYAALRKHVPVQVVGGTLVETAPLVPIAVYFLFFTHGQHGAIFGASLQAAALCLGAGLMTAIALLTYARAARTLQLTTLGIMQYAYPTSQLLLGLLLFHEPFTAQSACLLAGGLASITLYSWGGVRAVRGLRVAKRVVVGPLGLSDPPSEA